MTAFALFIRDDLSWNTFLMGFIPAFSINFVLGTFIPIMAVGDAFAGLFLKKTDSVIYNLLRMAAIVFLMTASMSFLVMLSQMGISPAFIIAFIHSFPASFAFAYAAAFIMVPVLIKITQKLCIK